MHARANSQHPGTVIRLMAEDGFELAATVFEPAGRARGVVLVNPGTAVPQRFFRKFAQYLSAGGLRVVTYDYRGIGLSRPASLRGFEARMTDWAKDVRAAVGLVEGRWRNEPWLLVAHSFGAQVIGLVDELRGATGAVLVGAQFGYLGHWPLTSRTLLRGLWGGVVPAVTAMAGYLPGSFGMGEDLPTGVAREWGAWCRHRDYLLGHVPGARARFARFDVPAVSYSFTDDWYAPGPAVRAIHTALSGADLVHRRFAPSDIGLPSVGHFGFFRPSAEATLWPEARGWLQSAASGAPSRLPSVVPGAIPIDPAEVALDLAYGRD